MEVTLMKPVQNERETQNRQNTTTTSESYNEDAYIRVKGLHCVISNFNEERWGH